LKDTAGNLHLVTEARNLLFWKYVLDYVGQTVFYSVGGCLALRWIWENMPEADGSFPDRIENV